MFTDHDQDPVATDPIFRPAPEGKPARVVGVVAKDRMLAAQGVRKLSTLIPVAGEDKRVRLVDQSELIDPAGDLIPAVEVERGIALRLRSVPTGRHDLAEAPRTGTRRS